MATLKDVIAKFRKELKTTYQAQKNIMDVTDRYLVELENAETGGGSGGIDYSTDEQDTGLKWIDGKKIYQKTIQKDSTNVSGTDVSIDVTSLNIDSCINLFGTFNRVVASTGTFEYTFNGYESEYIHSIMRYANYGSTQNIVFNIKLLSGETTSAQYITILYTKAS